MGWNGRRRAWAVALCAVVAGTGGAGLVADPAPEPLRITALLRAEAEVSLLALAPGRVQSIARREGESISGREAVVILDDVEAKLTVDLARADLEARRIDLERLRKLPRLEDKERAEAWYNEARAGLELAEKTLKSDLELHAGGMISDLSRQRSERSLDAARALAESRRLDLIILEKGAAPEDLRRAEIEVEKQQILLAQHERETGKLRIGGTREGRAFVSRVHVAPGQWIPAGSTVGELVYMDRLRVDLALPAADGRRVSRGTKVKLTSAAAPGVALGGAVVGVSPVVDAASGTIRVVVEADNPKLDLRPGEVAEIEFLL